MIADKAGNLYGTTPVGGGTDTCGPLKDQQSAGCGIVFKIAARGGESVLHAFTGGSDGASPGAGLTADGAGNLYGTTLAGGGTDNCGLGPYGCGVVFKIAANGTESVLHVFVGKAKDGAYPSAALIADQQGNFYGTTAGGGSTDNCGAQKKGFRAAGCGTVFKLAPDGTESILHVFTGGTDGAYPFGGVIADSTGNLYGTTAGGGGTANCGLGPYGCGIVFKLAPDGTETVLHVFTGKTKDGGYPTAGLIMDKNGNLYGTTYEGGIASCGNHVGCGTVFRLPE